MRTIEFIWRLINLFGALVLYLIFIYYFIKEENYTISWFGYGLLALVCLLELSKEYNKIEKGVKTPVKTETDIHIK